MKIAIIAEGDTEKAFEKVVREFLNNRELKPAIRIHPYDGGIPKGQKLKKQVERHLADGYDYVIALTDVYTGQNDFTDADDAKAKMRQWVGNNPKFIPHVALHDFEAWLLPYWERIKSLAKTNRNVPAGRPETINHNNPPAHRLKELFESNTSKRSYSKTRDVVNILRGQDLTVAADACPELKSFLNTLLTLSGGEPLP